MRDAIGGTQLFIIVIALVILFTTFIAVGVNYSNAFAIKNKIVNIIERNNGVSDDLTGDKASLESTLGQIEALLGENGYLVTGSCTGKDNEYLGTAININSTGINNCGERGIVCIKTVDNDEDSKDDTIKRKSYMVTVFYKIDIPIFSEAFTFKVTGTTKSLISTQNICEGA